MDVEKRSKWVELGQIVVWGAKAGDRLETIGMVDGPGRPFCLSVRRPDRVVWAADLIVTGLR